MLKVLRRIVKRTVKSGSDFADEPAFVSGLARETARRVRRMEQVPEEIKRRLLEIAAAEDRRFRMAEIFDCFNAWCEHSEMPVVLMIDEVDTATNNQVFLDFLAQLRAGYLERDEIPAFHSVILAGVYDIRNIQQKIRSDGEHRVNSPWNIAADFTVSMSFSPQNIAGMLEEYEGDHHTGMDIGEISKQIYSATSGYPYLVSKVCKLVDEELPGTERFQNLKSAWTRDGVLEAEKRLVNEDNSLFQSLTGKLEDYPKLRTMLYELLFTGRPIPYVPHNQDIQAAAMLGFIKNEGGSAVIANRIFESVLYNLFISQEFMVSRLYDVGEREKSF